MKLKIYEINYTRICLSGVLLPFGVILLLYFFMSEYSDPYLANDLFGELVGIYLIYLLILAVAMSVLALIVNRGNRIKDNEGNSE